MVPLRSALTHQTNPLEFRAVGSIPSFWGAAVRGMVVFFQEFGFGSSTFSEILTNPIRKTAKKKSPVNRHEVPRLFLKRETAFYMGDSMVRDVIETRSARTLVFFVCVVFVFNVIQFFHQRVCWSFYPTPSSTPRPSRTPVLDACTIEVARFDLFFLTGGAPQPFHQPLRQQLQRRNYPTIVRSCLYLFNTIPH